MAYCLIIKSMYGRSQILERRFYFPSMRIKVQMLDQLQEWQKIRIANGSEGWIKNVR